MKNVAYDVTFFCQKTYSPRRQAENLTILYDDLFSFGALHKNFRKRRHITQQHLAEVIGVHRSTIIRWERGDFLPENKGIVLELAKHLHLDDQETRQLLEASLTALTPHWHVPFPRNPLFTGRNEILEALHTHLRTDQVVAPTHSYALYGLGGIGKTQIALEYAYRYALEYSAVFWIEAETSERITGSLLRIAESLSLPEHLAADQPPILAAVQHWLATHSRWLLIWDNLEDLDLPERWLPPARQGIILITTRGPALGTLALGRELLPMEQEEGMRFLLHRAKLLEPGATREQIRQFAARSPTNAAAAEELVTTMGGLPLALDQAGAYIEETGCSLVDYVQRYEEHRAYLLSRRGTPGGHHPNSVATTFKLSMQQVEQEHRAAADLLRVCAFLQAEAIPEELFVAGSAHLGPELEALVTDSAQLDQAIAVLRRLSLVQRQAETHTLSMHRLVQAVLQDSMAQETRKQWAGRVTAALDAGFPEVLPAAEHAVWKQCERLFPHVLRYLHQETASESLVFASLAYKAAQYLRERCRFEEAEPLYRQALQIQERALGPDHPEVARTLNYLAVLFWCQGKYTEVETLYRRTLQIRERAPDSDHLEVARTLNNLALLFWSLGKYEQAEPLYQRAIPLYERNLGSDHPGLACILDNLALFRVGQGEYAEAEVFYQRALRISERSLNPNHLQVATLLNGLANLVREQGKYAEAEPLYRRALSIREQQLGQHPETAETLHELACLYQKQGKGCQAISLAERALSIRSQFLGEAHPETIATRTLSLQLAQEEEECLSEAGYRRVARRRKEKQEW